MTVWRVLGVVRSVAFLTPVMAATAADLHAQVNHRAALIEASVAWATNDAQRPERFNYEIERAIYAAGGCFFIAPRVAFGGEWVRLGAVVAPGGTSREQIEEEQREHAFLATARLRALTGSVGAIDVVGGAGLLRQSRATTFPRNPANDRTAHSVSPAFSLRVELPIALAKHFAIAPSAAVYFLRRDDTTHEPTYLSRRLPSTRAAFGAAAILVW